MTRAHIMIELPAGTRAAEFERDLAQLAQKYGTGLVRSCDPRKPIRYELPRRYTPQTNGSA